MSADMTLKQRLMEEIDVITHSQNDHHPDDMPMDEVIDLIEQVRDEGSVTPNEDLTLKDNAALNYSIGYIVGVAEALDKTIRELFDQENIQ